MKAGRWVSRRAVKASQRMRTKITTEASDTIEPTDERTFHVVYASG